MTDGLKTGLALAMAEAEARASGGGDVLQLALLPEVAEAEGEAGGKRPAHRPPGSRNKGTQAWRDLLLSRHGSPLLRLARFYDCDTLALAKALGCKPLEAAEFQRKCAEGVMPYVHGKMPVEDANGNAVLPVIQLVDPASAAAALAAVSGGAPVLDLEPLEMAEIRHSLDADQAGVGRSESDASPETQAAGGPEAAGQVICNQPRGADR